MAKAFLLVFSAGMLSGLALAVLAYVHRDRILGPSNSTASPASLTADSTAVPLPVVPIAAQARGGPAAAQPVEPGQPIRHGAIGDAEGNQIRGIVLTYVRRYANDPMSVEVVEWKLPIRVANPHGWQISPNQQDYDTAILATIRARNELGALAVGSMLFFLKNRQVVDTMSERWPSFEPAVKSVYRVPLRNAWVEEFHRRAKQGPFKKPPVIGDDP